MLVLVIILVAVVGGVVIGSCFREPIASWLEEAGLIKKDNGDNNAP